ncbi:MAG: LemA family protein [Alphaproteobacteria bacterium]|nr:LemA family protein [Alphaproteobacteria bacterium]MBR6327671.1 LemA family protein [Alphaproteobacteria bacterium]
MVIFYIVLGVILVGLYMLYAGLIKKRNALKEAASDVDVQLKKRYDLIPNLLDMAAKFMSHEKQLFADIVNLRNDALKQNFVLNADKSIELDNALEGKLKSFFVNVENYPELKSSATMVQAMQSFDEAEENIAAARRFYNSALTELKNAVEIFPSSMIAALIGIKADKPYFEATDAARERINAKEYFK